jgi:beta-glucanase (GH16 family)
VQGLFFQKKYGTIKFDHRRRDILAVVNKPNFNPENMRITLQQWFRSSLLVIALAMVTGAGAQTLIWSDEFNKAKLDDDKWTREVGGNGFGNGELQYYTSGESNVFIGSKTNATDTGFLVIEARRENYGVAPENRQFTSGRINTSGKFNFKYGTIEARIKLPNLQNGLWPAFWMLGANYPTVGWPRSGEIDILEAGFKDDWQNNVANKKNNSTVHWFQDNFQEIDPNAPGDGWWGNASATGSITIPGSFTDGYHLFKIVWTPTAITGYVDNVQYYNFTIPANDVNITEFNNPFYFILNLAVGGTNFVGITDPAQITAPMPAQMQVDYIRVFSNANTEFFAAKNLPKQTGTFGVYTETKPVNGSLGTSPTIEVWSNLTAATSTPFEGSNVLSFTANPGNWFGLGIPTGATNVKNMQNFIDGKLYFHMKTTSNWPFSIGFISTMNGNAQASTQTKTVKLDPAAPNQYGLVRDGQWHEVAIPLSAFGNVEFRSINNMFYIVGDNPSAPVTFALDNIYWQDGTKITPQNGDYVLYSDTKTGVDKFDQPADGNFFIWEQTLLAQATTPAEGANVLSFTHNNKGWFGAAFTASAMHNLTAYNNANAKLVLSLKTSDTTTPFYLGMKSGTRDGDGQKWIAFEPGTTPYGFTRNGTWQTVQIPMSDFASGVNLMEVTQVLEILGTGNIANIAIDNIYFTGGGTAEPDGNSPPVANAGADKAVTLPTSSVTLNGTGTDSDGTITAYAWTRQSGPNNPTLTNANTANLTASGLIAGTYVFRLTVTDNQGAAAFDDVNVVVSGNTPPTASAGADQSITLPANSVTLNGAGSDPGGSITGYAWIRVSGPNNPTMTNANTASLTASGLIAGNYVFRLTVTDNGGLTGSDEVSVTVASAPAGNLALNKTVTVSSTENAGTPGSAAVDGNAGTRWSSLAADPQWIYVDLGQTYSVSRVKITWETALGKDYLVQIGANTSSWTTLKTVTGNTALTNDHTGLSGSGRYIRIYGTARGTQWGYSIWELEVYGTSGNVAPTANAGADKSITLPTNSVTINGTGSDTDGTISTYAWTAVSGPNTPTMSGAATANLTASGLIAGTYVFRLTVTDNGGLTGSDEVNVVVASAPAGNIALNKIVTVSSTENAGTPGSAAVDGNAGTRWSSAFSDPQWIYVDLGGNFNVNRVKITWETASSKDYLVQIGTSTSSWTTMKTITNNTTLVNDHTGLTGTGRYVRIYSTARTTQYGVSIFELEVYGTAAGRLATESNLVEEAADDVVILYPNPAINVVHVEGVKNGTPVRAFAPTGTRAYDFRVSEGTIDVTVLPSGAYILDFNIGLRSIRKKLIKL